MRKLNEYDPAFVNEILNSEEWSRPLPPVTRVTPSGWLTVAFWGLRVYVLMMLGVVAYAFARGVH